MRSFIFNLLSLFLAGFFCCSGFIFATYVFPTKPREIHTIVTHYWTSETNAKEELCK